MLVLKRKEGEKVILRTPSGEVITVTVYDAHEGVTRLGFEADRSIKIHRKEIDDRINGKFTGEGEA